MALLKVLHANRVSLCFTLKLLDNKRETGANERERERERESKSERAESDGGGERAVLRAGVQSGEGSIIYTGTSCRLDYFNFFFFSLSLSLSQATVQLLATAKVVLLCRAAAAF